MVNITEELELVRLYLKLIKARFKDRFNIMFDIDDNIRIRIPMLIIQPLVENAV